METTKLGCLSLNSIYSYSINGGRKTGDMDSRPCFSQYLNRISNEEIEESELDIIVCNKTRDEIRKRSGNNFCLISKEDMADSLEYLKNTYQIPFEYTITEDKAYWGNEYHIKLKIARRKTEVKFVLTWIRHFYEFPFNVFLVDAMKLKNEVREFQDQHLVNILQLIGSSYNAPAVTDWYYREYRSDQCLCKPMRKWVTVDRIIENNAKKSSITGSYVVSLSDAMQKKVQRFMVDTEDEYETSLTYEYWTDPNTFNDRLQVYMSNYELWKKAGVVKKQTNVEQEYEDEE